MGYIDTTASTRRLPLRPWRLQGWRVDMKEGGREREGWRVDMKEVFNKKPNNILIKIR